MRPVEIIALIFVILALLDMFSSIFKPKSYLKRIRYMFANAAMLKIIFLALTLIVGYYLLMELSIVQIFAVLGFASLLFGIAFAEFPKATMACVNTVLAKKNVFQQAWLSVLIWSILIVWVLWQLLT